MSKRTYRVKFSHYEIKQEHVEYIMKVQDIESKEEFTIRDRYKAMREYWKAMTSKHGKAVSSKFPAKKFFGNKDPEFIKRRMQDLEDYFNVLLGDPNLAESPITQRYFSNKRIKEKKKAPLLTQQEELKVPIKNKDTKTTAQIISDEKFKHIVDSITKSYIDIGFGEEPPPFEEAKKKTLEYSSALSNNINSKEYVSRLVLLPKGENNGLSLGIICNEEPLSKWLDGKMQNILNILEDGVEMYRDEESILSTFEMNF